MHKMGGMKVKRCLHTVEVQVCCSGLRVEGCFWIIHDPSRHRAPVGIKLKYLTVVHTYPSSAYWSHGWLLKVKLLFPSPYHYSYITTHHIIIHTSPHIIIWRVLTQFEFWLWNDELWRSLITCRVIECRLQIAIGTSNLETCIYI